MLFPTLKYLHKQDSHSQLIAKVCIKNNIKNIKLVQNVMFVKFYPYFFISNVTVVASNMWVMQKHRPHLQVHNGSVSGLMQKKLSLRIWFICSLHSPSYLSNMYMGWAIIMFDDILR